MRLFKLEYKNVIFSNKDDSVLWCFKDYLLWGVRITKMKAPELYEYIINEIT